MLLEFWGKSDPADGTMAAHSVAHHCLDVAAAAAALLAIYPPPVEVPAATISALVALHDVGKRWSWAAIPWLLRIVLGEWCSSFPNPNRMAGPSSHRHNLDGSRAAELTEEEKAVAAKLLVARRERWKKGRRERMTLSPV
jgi:hypothetical protein